MEVPVNPELQARLCSHASEWRHDTQAFVREATERFVDYSRNERTVVVKNATSTAPMNPPL